MTKFELVSLAASRMSLPAIDTEVMRSVVVVVVDGTVVVVVEVVVGNPIGQHSGTQ